MTYTHIETIELDSSASSITFSSIPQDYDDLVLVIAGRVDKTGSFGYLAGLDININGDGFGANISGVKLQAIPNVSSFGNEDVPMFTGDDATANTFGNGVFYFSNYKSSQSKSISVDGVVPNNSSSFGIGIGAILYSNSSAITSVALRGESFNFVSGSTASLYGVTAGGDGTVTTS